jgi:hypothetical protein
MGSGLPNNAMLFRSGFGLLSVGAHEGMLVPYTRLCTPFYIALLGSGATTMECVVPPIKVHEWRI